MFDTHKSFSPPSIAQTFRRMTLELYHSRNLLIAKGRLLKRRRLRTPPRSSIEVLAELFIACNHADLNTVQLRIAELGTLFNPNAFAINCPDFPNSRDVHGAYNRTTTLLLAAIHAESRPRVSAKRLAVVRLLLEAGANPNLGVRGYRKPSHYDDDYEPALDDYTFERLPLQCAVCAGDHHIVLALLRAGADPNAPERSDRATPPIMAFEFARYDLPSILPKILETLMAFGADINSRDGLGETLLLRLLKPRDVSEIDHEDNLMWPAAFLPSCVGTVLRAGANPNLGDRTGALPLHYAVALGDPALVKLLLQAGAHPDAAPPAQTQAEREAHLHTFLHPLHVLKHKREWRRAEHGVRFPYAQRGQPIANLPQCRVRCFHETPWQLATLLRAHLFVDAPRICHNARRVESLLRQNRAWRKLRAFCRLRYQLFNLYELVCTPDRIDVAADLAAATDGLYAT